MTTAERNAIVTPASSLLIFNTTTNCFETYINAQWQTMFCNTGCSGAPSAPTAGTNTPSQTQVVWNWNSVSGATGYKWGTTTTYSAATDNGASLTTTQTGFSCGTAHTIYVWAYNACGNSATYATLSQNTTACCAGGIQTSGCGGFTTMTDARDSKTYNIKQIGTQCWMAQNLNYGTYIAVMTSGAGTGQNQAATQKFCQTLGGVNDPTCAMGGLYEWAEMMDGSTVNNTAATNSCIGDATCPPCATTVQGICPSGWHVPSHYEWTLLEKNVGTTPGAFPYDVSTNGVWLGTDEGSNLKQAGTTNWTTPNTGATNSSGFTALPGGCSFEAHSMMVVTWSLLVVFYREWHVCLEAHPVLHLADVIRNADVKEYGFSVRCVKN